MTLYAFKQALQGLEFAAKTCVDKNININEAPPKNHVLDFEESKKEYHRKAVRKYLDNVLAYASTLTSLADVPENKEYWPHVQQLLSELDLNNMRDMQIKAKEMHHYAKYLQERKIERVTKTPERLPEDIKAEILADLNEIDKAFKAKCFRSATILCGRVLETALHRKYYDTTGFDILEKNPGIGLGNLIGKLREKGVTLDPALNQQIHLINQVRVFAVHKKLEPFHPSEDQARAMVLYTCDVLTKLF